ncbi:hypothetical protein PtA15_11A519 [Puccinia triticina]|uniref:RxLR effector protein n=1 Tax=Puccinia triticina TaxID=208348 RepID=A0ABY7CX04_9BASI|nr:uncharacterized protein PtA15_11A519 [Puccinia triticina]WAQ89828.1 hypothetical protein PtA15_11A519 [Puccinia triticina]
MLLHPGTLAIYGALLLLITRTPAQCYGASLSKRMSTEIHAGESAYLLRTAGSSGTPHERESHLGKERNSGSFLDQKVLDVTSPNPRQQFDQDHKIELVPEEKENLMKLKAFKIVASKKFGIKPDQIDEAVEWFQDLMKSLNGEDLKHGRKANFSLGKLEFFKFWKIL